MASGITERLAGSMTTTCGFIGLGQMGAPMACNLAKGARVIIWARDPQQAASVVAAGATLAPDAKAFADAQVVFLCLPNGTVVEDILFGPFGLAKALPKGAGRGRYQHDRICQRWRSTGGLPGWASASSMRRSRACRRGRKPEPSP